MFNIVHREGEPACIWFNAKPTLFVYCEYASCQIDVLNGNEQNVIQHRVLYMEITWTVWHTNSSTSVLITAPLQERRVTNVQGESKTHNTIYTVIHGYGQQKAILCYNII